MPNLEWLLLLIFLIKNREKKRIYLYLNLILVENLLSKSWYYYFVQIITFEYNSYNAFFIYKNKSEKIGIDCLKDQNFITKLSQDSKISPLY